MMNEKDKIIEKFHQQVDWLKRNVDEDDIYEFAQQVLISAQYFLYKWGEWVDLEEEAAQDQISGDWIHNLLSIERSQRLNIDEKINVELRERDFWEDINKEP